MPSSIPESLSVQRSGVETRRLSDYLSLRQLYTGGFGLPGFPIPGFHPVLQPPPFAWKRTVRLISIGA